MKEIMEEYGGFLLALAGGFGLFAVLKTQLFSATGILARMIELWTGNAC